MPLGPRPFPAMDQSLHIALVTPFSWSIPAAVNCHVADLARELKALGHRPVIVTSSDDPSELARTKALFQRTRGRLVELLEEYRSGCPPHDLLLPTTGEGPLSRAAGIPVVPVGYSFPVRLNGGVASLGLPVDVTSRLEKLMIGGGFDLVHVHEPLAPSLSFTALREARSPVVGSFHLTPVGVAAYEMGQSVLERFFSRLDARVVTFPHGRTLMDELYPGEYQVVSCGTSLSLEALAPSVGAGASSRASGDGFSGSAGHGGGRTALHVYRGDARRSYRALMRALLADFPADIDTLVVALHRPSAERWVPRTVPRRLRDRVTLREFDGADDLAGLYGSADVVILPYLGGEWLCASLAEAAVSGRPFVGPELPPVVEQLATGARGAVFSPATSGSLAAAVDRATNVVHVEAGLLKTASASSGAAASAADLPTMPAVAARLAAIYRQTIAATVPKDRATARTVASGASLHVRGIGAQSTRKRVRQGVLGRTRADWINADLHVHSEFSKDCVSSVESIIATAREIGLGALAIADHNEIEGAFLARELAQGDPFIIVAEEVKTSEGEVIGLFLREAIPRGLTFDQTLSLIKEQDGLVYVPHPFDALRTTPSYRTLVDNLHRIDVIEIYNAKVALSSFNLSAERFAAKYNIVAGAGSDAHVLQALGTAMLHMPRFHDAPSFLAALWEADIIARRKNLLYLQSLKLLQTTLDRVLPED